MLRLVRGASLLRASAAAAPPRTPPLLLRATSRALCDAAPDPDELRKKELLDFLRTASRPIMGKAKAPQSAGQRAIDLTKQLKNLDDLDLRALLRLDTEALKKRGLPCQERKRLLSYTDKYVQGWRPDTRAMGKNAWRSWRPPYHQRGHPLYQSHTGMRPYNNHVVLPDAPPPPELERLEPIPPPVTETLRSWVKAMRAKDKALAGELHAELLDAGIDPYRVRPTVFPEDEADAETKAKLQRWADAKNAADYATSDALREELRAVGIEPMRAMRGRVGRTPRFKKEMRAAMEAAGAASSGGSSADVHDSFWAR